MKSLIISLVCGLALTGSASALNWTDSYDAAVSKAKTDHKLILLDFTGSDWCGFCKLLDKEVFDTNTFSKYASANYELVTVDFPHDKELSATIKAQNDRLGKKFNIDGYPTLIVLDTHGKELSRMVGYQPGSGPDAVIEKLKSHK